MNIKVKFALSYLIIGLIIILIGLLLLLSYDLKQMYSSNQISAQPLNLTNIFEIYYVNKQNEEFYLYWYCQTQRSNFIEITDKTHPANSKKENTNDSSYFQKFKIRSYFLRKLTSLIVCSKEEIYILTVILIIIFGLILSITGFFRFCFFEINARYQNKKILKKDIFCCKRKIKSFEADSEEKEKLKNFKDGLSKKDTFSDSEVKKFNIIHTNTKSKRKPENSCPFTYEELPAFMKKIQYLSFEESNQGFQKSNEQNLSFVNDQKPGIPLAPPPSFSTSFKAPTPSSCSQMELNDKIRQDVLKKHSVTFLSHVNFNESDYLNAKSTQNVSSYENKLIKQSEDSDYVHHYESFTNHLNLNGNRQILNNAKSNENELEDFFIERNKYLMKPRGMSTEPSFIEYFL